MREPERPPTFAPMRGKAEKTLLGTSDHRPISSTAGGGAGSRREGPALSARASEADERSPCRLVIAEDSLLLREGLVRLVTEAGFEVVGQAGDAEDLVRKVSAHRPDLAIIDVRMPPTNTDDGLRAALDIRRRMPETGVLVLSEYVVEAYAYELLGDGAAGVGYLLKHRVVELDRFVDSLRRVAQGGSVLDPEVVSHLVRRDRESGGGIAELSERELETLALMAEGRSNQGIAEDLVVTDRTVEKHVRSIFVKLGLDPEPRENRRVMAVLRYLREGAPEVTSHPERHT